MDDEREWVPIRGHLNLLRLDGSGRPFLQEARSLEDQQRALELPAEVSRPDLRRHAHLPHKESHAHLPYKESAM